VDRVAVGAGRQRSLETDVHGKVLTIDGHEALGPAAEGNLVVACSNKQTNKTNQHSTQAETTTTTKREEKLAIGPPIGHRLATGGSAKRHHGGDRVPPMLADPLGAAVKAGVSSALPHGIGGRGVIGVPHSVA